MSDIMQTCNMDERTNEEKFRDNIVLRYKMAVLAKLSGLGSNATRQAVYQAVDEAFEEVDWNEINKTVDSDDNK